ncbi:serine/threonine-protein phosphatase [Candidatus Accumulibacter phosphatis]|uniref:Serine/threonine-protein phosphatase n=1 Tax=Candidatus Accumulibacter phosphatis TaxID=327160 RepID=A0ABX1TYC9_9PROT|nr:PP2C family serine/threonine-protein phosphatase [Candidatus Accumulibacter phosphatis]NMQ28238.1 serine/threonine-protein phosphatase [Candidatus Accumulibacter phosphatis]
MNTIPSLIQDQLTTWLLRRTPANGVRRVASLSAALASDVGNVREGNQDRLAAVRGRDQHGSEYALVAVADGIGGMHDGGTCAAMTVGAFIATVDRLAQNGDQSQRPEDWLREGAHAANAAVYSKFRASGGSTLVAILIRPETRPYWLSIGDSRVYCMDDRTLRQTSIDDTIAGQLGKSPEDVGEQSRLLQFVGMGADLEPHIARLDAKSVEAVMLTTDGIHYLSHSPGWLGQIIRHSPDPGVCVKRLLDLAKWCGGPDNATVAMITLPVDLKAEAIPGYPCLEIWDAYGELQIISAPLSHAPSRYMPNTTPLCRSKPVPGMPPIVGLGPVIDEQATSPTPEQTKLRRSRAPRKPKKPTEERSNDKPDEPQLPQLHMDFPAKSDE